MPTLNRSTEGEDEGKEIKRLRRGRLDKDVLTLGLVCKEVIDFAGCAVVGNDGEALVVHVENEVLALEGGWNKKKGQR